MNPICPDLQQKRRSTGRLLALLATLVLGGLWLPGCQESTAGPELDCQAPPPPEEALRQMGTYQDGSMVLPGNRLLTPAGLHIPLGGYPVDLRVHPSQRVAYVSNTGYRKRELQVVDIDTGEIKQELERVEAFYGLHLTAAADRLYAGGGDSGRVDVYDVAADGSVSEATHIQLGGFPAGIAPAGDGTHIWVAQFEGGNLVQVNTLSGSVLASVRVDFGVYGVLKVPGRDELYVSILAGTKVAVFDLATQSVTARIELGGNPLGLAARPDGSRVYVSVADADRVFAIDPATQAVVASRAVGGVDIVDDDGEPLPASSPSGLVFDADNDRVVVTRGADNAVTFLAGDDLTIQGSVPVGWYPTAVGLADAGTHLVVTNGKGFGTGPLLGYGHGHPSGKEQMNGSLSLVDLENLDLAEATAQVAANVKRPTDVWQWSCEGSFPVPTHRGGETPIKHIVLIVRENKTFDCLMGDLPGVDGDPDLLLYDDVVVPNIRALAQQFVHHDNFYDDSETSVQGHLWLTSSFVNDYMERIWLEDYRGNGFGNEAPFAQAQPDFGTFFTHLHKHDVSFRNYGEVVGTFIGAGALHTDMSFPGVFYNLDVKDEEKAQYVADKLLADAPGQGDSFPQFTFVLLPNDHTKGTGANNLTPEAMISDNDYATGLLVDRISHSDYWDKTAIFIVEDDPQNGADHVDYHRSILVIASPWVKQGQVSSVHTSIPSLFRTFELILGLPPMNRYDALATPLWDAFGHQPDLTPYDVLPRQVPDMLNSGNAPGAAYSRRMDFSGPDRNPELGVILWWARRGEPPPHSRIARELRGEIPSRIDMPAGAEHLSGGTQDDEGDEEREREGRGWQQFYRWLDAHPGVRPDLRPGPTPPRNPLPQSWR